MRRPEHDQIGSRLFDLVVVGGGITGVATARDAALRGLSVVLVEKDDFAAGTSSRSSKLIHGGLRYLETYQFSLVAESLRERERALRTAPHLTEVSPFLYLLYEQEKPAPWLLNLGLTFYDAASGAWASRRHRMLDAEQVLRREPYLRSEGLRGAGLYHDVLTDDARLTLDTAKGAAEAGALLMNHTEVVGLVLDGGRARGVEVQDHLSGERFVVHARQVVSATGPWTDRTRALEYTQPAPGHGLRPTKGVHIVVRKSDFPLDTPVFLRSPDDGRVVWPTPSLEDDVVYIGTTDTDYDGDLDDVHPDERDVQYLLNVANHTIPTARLTQDHVVGSWAGLRPLVAPPPGVSASGTSREHEIATGPTGMLTISGGKLTSARLMAKQLVDAVQRGLGTGRTRSTAGDTPISGGDVARTREARAAALAAGVPGVVVDTWARRYGANASEILRRWTDDEANREVIGRRHLTRAELSYLLDEEMAGSVQDVLVRRTSAFYWDADGGLDAVEAVADALADRHGWDAARREREITGYTALVRRHRPGGWAPDAAS